MATVFVANGPMATGLWQWPRVFWPRKGLFWPRLPFWARNPKSGPDEGFDTPHPPPPLERFGPVGPFTSLMRLYEDATRHFDAERDRDEGGVGENKEHEVNRIKCFFLWLFVSENKKA